MREQGPGTTYNLLFVCTGNTCRSPMAEAIARRMLEERGWHHVAVGSAGIAAADNAPASAEAVEVAREHNLDLLQHQARGLTPERVAWADMILTMSPSHAQAVEALGGEGKTYPVTEWVDSGFRGQAVADPFGGDVAAYRLTFAQLSDSVHAVLGRLEPILAP